MGTLGVREEIGFLYELGARKGLSFSPKTKAGGYRA